MEKLVHVEKRLSEVTSGSPLLAKANKTKSKKLITFIYMLMYRITFILEMEIAV